MHLTTGWNHPHWRGAKDPKKILDVGQGPGFVTFLHHISSCLWSSSKIPETGPFQFLGRSPTTFHSSATCECSFKAVESVARQGVVWCLLAKIHLHTHTPVNQIWSWRALTWNQSSFELSLESQDSRQAIPWCRGCRHHTLTGAGRVWFHCSMML